MFATGHTPRAGRRKIVCVSTASTPRDRLLSLAACADPASLRSAMSELCSEFGKVSRLEIFTLAEAEKRQALCLLRLESPEEQRRMRTVLGAAWFGDDILIVVDLHHSNAADVARRPQEAM
jgi:hypothetical protein